ncbi:hypothetical protein EDF54_0249, partial [Rathayibacter sp. PhB93]
ADAARHADPRADATGHADPGADAARHSEHPDARSYDGAGQR